jgi:hypothetical protein
MKYMSHETSEGQLVKHVETGKVWTVVMDYPHKKVIESAKGTQVHVPPDFFKYYVEVVQIIDFTNGNEYLQ